MINEEKLYLKCRKVGKSLHSQMIQLLSKRDILIAGTHLGMYHRDIFIFDFEEEVDILMDYAVYDYLGQGKPIVEIFVEQIGDESLNEVQKMVLEGALKAWFSLFEICDIQHKDNCLILRDLIYRKEDITLIDINLSRTGIVGMLLATRLIPIRTWHMNTGIIFPFQPELKQKLLQGLRIPIRKGKKKRYKTIPPHQYCPYLFRRYKQLSNIEFMSKDVT